LAGTALAGLPVLAAAAPMHAGGRGGPQNYTVLPRGPVTLRQLVDLYPYPNTLAALQLTAAELADWLERAASLYRQVLPGAQDAELIEQGFPFFNFDTVEGVTWRFDISQPSRFDLHGALLRPHARRVLDLRLNGVPMRPDQPLILATNSYRLSGAGGFAVGLEHRVVYRSKMLTRDVVEQYIAGLEQLPPPGPPHWGFQPLPDTTVLFDSAPQAVPPGGPAPSPRIEALELAPNGFRSFRLYLDPAMTRA
jgi:2',3'-cyclic-nucleotide 2'-phosphodiesterase/3'-nucleotidase